MTLNRSRLITDSSDNESARTHQFVIGLLILRAR